MLDYLPLIVILAALGAMAYFLTKGNKKGHEEREAMAKAKGWSYSADQSVVVAGKPNSQRNILYLLTGSSTGGTAWEMTARTRMEIEESVTLKSELMPSTEWLTTMPLAGQMLLLPTDGTNLPDVVFTQALQSMGFPTDMQRLAANQLPPEMVGAFEVFIDNSALNEKISALAPHLGRWRSTYPRAKNAITIAGGPDGIRMNTTFTLEKAADMEAMVNTGLSLII
jgi:hypothetical protein